MIDLNDPSVFNIDNGSVKALVRAKARLFILLTSVEQCLQNPFPIIKASRQNLVSRIVRDLTTIEKELEIAITFLSAIQIAYSKKQVVTLNRLEFATEVCRVDHELSDIAFRFEVTKLLFNKNLEDFENDINTNFAVS